MNKNESEGLYYWDYLQLDQLLSAQTLESAKYGKPAHDEMFFIVIHQAYELWFKQILHELDSICEIMAHPVLSDHTIAMVVHRLKRVTEIQELLISQLGLLKTMTPMDFLEFRDALTPASGFQSLTFRLVENRLGLISRTNLDNKPNVKKLRSEHQDIIAEAAKKPSLITLVEKWLERIPFMVTDEFHFWQSYESSVMQYLNVQQQKVKNKGFTAENLKVHERQLQVELEHFTNLFDKLRYQEQLDKGQHRFSHAAIGAALFIYLYRDQPVFHLPFQLLSSLVTIDELFTEWRYGHAIMVLRMIGTKVGTGGTPGYDYLRATVEKHKVFSDIANLTTYLVPRHVLPHLDEDFSKRLGFVYSNMEEQNG